MSDVKQLLDATRTIESILETTYGGVGRGMHEKLSSATRPVPPYLVKKIRYIASVRNKTVHEAGYEVEDISAFVQTCHEVIRQLRELADSPPPKPSHLPSARTAPTVSTPSAPPAQGPGALQHVLVWGSIAALGLWGAQHWLTRSANTPTDPAQTAGTRTAPAPATAPHQAPSNAVTPPKSAAAPSAAAAAPAARPASAPAKQPAAAVQGPVALSNLSLRFAKGTFGDQEPHITVTLHNQLNTTLASVQLDARLFLNGERKPLIDAGRKDRGSSLFVHLGERGLRAGEKRTVTIQHGRMDAALWRTPDVLNAHSRRLDVALSSYRDGADQRVAARSDYLSTGDVAVARPAATPARKPSAPAPASAAAPSSAPLTLQGVRVTYAKGTFGDMEPRIRATFTNHSDHTMAHASIAARLFLNGDKEPAVTSPSRHGGDALFAHFGESGLRAGESRTVTLTASRIGHRAWQAPDAINATQHHVQLAVLSYTDGRAQRVQVNAPDRIRWP